METIEDRKIEIDLATIKIGIVTPMSNEINTATQFIKEVLSQSTKYPFKSVALYLVFDNVCTDGTMDMLHDEYKDDPRVNIVFAPENRCVVDAYMRGYKEALADANEWILEIDAGFSHLPSDIPLFIETMQKGYDCVFGSRFMKDSVYTRDNLKRYIVSKGGTFLTNLLIGTRLKDMTSGFEMFTNKTLSSILAKGIRSKGPFFQTEIKTHAHQFDIVEVPIHYKDGSHSINNSTIQDSLSCLWHLFKKRLANEL